MQLLGGNPCGQKSNLVLYEFNSNIETDALYLSNISGFSYLTPHTISYDRFSPVSETIFPDSLFPPFVQLFVRINMRA